MPELSSKSNVAKTSGKAKEAGGQQAPTTIPLDRILTEWAPGSQPQPWTWDQEELDILRRSCCCRSGMCESPKEHLRPGQYQLDMEAHIVEHGITQGVYLGPDGRVWDGHHRIVAARRLGITELPLEDGSAY